MYFKRMIINPLNTNQHQIDKIPSHWNMLFTNDAYFILVMYALFVLNILHFIFARFVSQAQI